MKRGKPLARKAPLKAAGGLSRRGRLNRGAELTRKAQAKPQRPKVTPEEREARRLVRARSEGRCEVCGREPMSNFQHRKGKAHLGEWSASNGLAVCGMGNVSGCHGRIHQSPAIAYERGWSVRSTANPAEVPVWLAGKGWHYLTPDGGVTPTERSAA